MSTVRGTTRHPDGTKIQFQTGVARAIRRTREAHGLTQLQVARAIGTSQSHINKIEDGTVATPAYTIYLLAILFDCTTDDLLCDPSDEAAA
jgi:transcriptional regulator with XRE-family HTH domain